MTNEEKKAFLLLQQENMAIKHAMLTRDISDIDAQIAIAEREAEEKAREAEKEAELNAKAVELNAKAAEKEPRVVTNSD